MLPALFLLPLARWPGSGPVVGRGRQGWRCRDIPPVHARCRGWCGPCRLRCGSRPREVILRRWLRIRRRRWYLRRRARWLGRGRGWGSRSSRRLWSRHIATARRATSNNGRPRARQVPHLIDRKHRRRVRHNARCGLRVVGHRRRRCGARRDARHRPAGNFVRGHGRRTRACHGALVDDGARGDHTTHQEERSGVHIASPTMWIAQ